MNRLSDDPLVVAARERADTARRAWKGAITGQMARRRREFVAARAAQIAAELATRQTEQPR